MPDRAVASPVAVALLLLVVVATAGVLGAGAMGLADAPTAPEPVAFAVDASPSGRITLVHRGGQPLDVRELDVRVTVDGEPLDRQPPVPFFSARGFESGPTGPFNTAADPQWSVGESAGFQVAATNEPSLTVGATVAVELLARGQPAGRATATVRRGAAGSLDADPATGLDRPPPSLRWTGDAARFAVGSQPLLRPWSRHAGPGVLTPAAARPR